MMDPSSVLCKPIHCAQTKEQNVKFAVFYQDYPETTAEMTDSVSVLTQMTHLGVWLVDQLINCLAACLTDQLMD